MSFCENLPEETVELKVLDIVAFVYSKVMGTICVQPMVKIKVA